MKCFRFSVLLNVSACVVIFVHLSILIQLNFGTSSKFCTRTETHESKKKKLPKIGREEKSAAMIFLKVSLRTNARTSSLIYTPCVRTRSKQWNVPEHTKKNITLNRFVAYLYLASFTLWPQKYRHSNDVVIFFDEVTPFCSQRENLFSLWLLRLRIALSLAIHDRVQLSFGLDTRCALTHSHAVDVSDQTHSYMCKNWWTRAQFLHIRHLKTTVTVVNSPIDSDETENCRFRTREDNVLQSQSWIVIVQTCVRCVLWLKLTHNRKFFFYRFFFRCLFCKPSSNLRK